MKTPRQFVFESYALDRSNGIISLVYRFDDSQRFIETIRLPGPVTSEVADDVLEPALFALHLIGGISYFKAFCPPEIIIASGKLDRAGARFWQTVYEKGLGEFSYQNSLDLRGKIVFPAQLETMTRVAEAPPNYVIPRRPLVLFGGGKDSLASAQILGSNDIPITFMRLGPHPVIRRLFTELDQPYIELHRKLDPGLTELNQDGAYNGHVPISAYISCLSVVLSLLYGYDAVVISSERSSSYGNVTYLGEEINHQWSKSAEFESLFTDYLSRYITNQVRYVNLLGSLSELSITKLVTAQPDYLRLLTSCNANWKLLETERLDVNQKGLWCRRCPKCAFTFVLFLAWLPLDEVVTIFGENLIDVPANLALFRELFGLAGFKPFECVGTPEEMVVAFHLGTQRQPLGDTLVGAMYETEVIPLCPAVNELVISTLEPDARLAEAPPFVIEWLANCGIHR
jgi:hypothetical protein